MIFEEYVEPENSLFPDALRCQPRRPTPTQLTGTRRSPDVREHAQTNVGALSSFKAETSIAFIDTCNKFTSFLIEYFLFVAFEMEFGMRTTMLMVVSTGLAVFRVEARSASGTPSVTSMCPSESRCWFGRCQGNINNGTGEDNVRVNVVMVMTSSSFHI